jgi:hypothetical protein
MAVKKKEAETRPYQFQIDPVLLEKSKKKAKSEGLMLSQVLRRFLMDYTANPQGKLFG